MKNKAVFFDRDGTINSTEGRYYVYRLDDLQFNPGVIDGIRRLNEAGYLVVVITNQGGIAKGIYEKRHVETFHGYMRFELRKHGARIDKIYYCPHHESVAPCCCRKPSPYLIELAMRQLDIDPAVSYMIGDSQSDMEAARAAGVTGIRIRPNSDLTPAIDRVLGEQA
ncbi:MAG: HAD family hydrolase [Odoribacteraceae bacterium]|jgi:D-glycero-D-manno-heptose 1,7-bisphosphate phosphatase|nr:HAD family hydrolase [Odoribacteraceae bacterium]